MFDDGIPPATRRFVAIGFSVATTRTSPRSGPRTSFAVMPSATSRPITVMGSAVRADELHRDQRIVRKVADERRR